MPKLTDAEISARDDGRDAFEEGKGRGTNPHSALSANNLYTCWNDGWDEARTEFEEREEDAEDAEEDRDASA